MTGVIYARYSSEKQTINSINGQVRECRQFAERNGISIIDIYTDEAISGRTAEKRPSFMKMIKDASLKFFDCIIVWKGDRFSRSRADAAKYKSLLKSYGVKVLSATEANCTGPEAILMDGINEAFAEYFSVELAAKVERGMTQNALEGKFNGGILPLGYVKEGKGVAINPDEARIVVEMFRLLGEENRTQKEVVKIFEQKGYKDKKGGKITKSTLNRMVHCEKYYGHYEFKGTVNDDMYPPIISKELFDKTVQKCRVNQISRSSYQARIPYLLSGKLICGECFETMTGTKATGRHGDVHYYYKCKNYQKCCNTKYVKKDEIEDAVISAAIDYIMDQKKMDQIASAFIEFSNNSLPDLNDYKKRLDEINLKIESLLQLIGTAGNIQILADEFKKLQNEKNEQEQLINSFKRDNDVFSEEHIRKFFKQLRIKDYLTTANKKYLIESVIEYVYYCDDKNIKIFFKNPAMGNYGDQRLGVRPDTREAHHLVKFPLVMSGFFISFLYGILNRKNAAGLKCKYGSLFITSKIKSTKAKKYIKVYS